MERECRLQDDLQLLERQLEAARREGSQGEVISLQERLLKRTRREQEQLIQRFAHQHWRALLVLAARLVGHNDAQDVAQEAFLSLTKWITKKPLLEAMSLLESIESLLKLMYKITSCRAYEFLRKRGKREELRDEEKEIDDVVDESPMPHPHTAIEIARLERAYTTLPAAQRIAHVLHHYYGFTDAEFEATLGIAKTNSRTLVRRATLALKRAMETKQ